MGGTVKLAANDASGPDEENLDSAELRRRFADVFETVRRSLDAPSEISPATRFGDYEVGPRLGRGAMGVVHRGKHVLTGKEVALKFARANTSEGRRLLEEAKALGRINHPNVLDVHGVGKTEEFVWLATNLIEGRTLADWIEEKTRAAIPSSPRLTPNEVRLCMSWFRDLARGLQASHDAERVHLDVKPANIMIGNDGIPRLVDYGLSARVGRGTTALVLGGTVPYMSPEQVLAHPGAMDGRSDVYSLAVTFHEALTGVRVVDFDADHEAVDALRRKVALAAVPIPSRVAPWLGPQFDSVFSVALRKVRDERYASAADLAEDLSRCLAGRAPRTAPDSPRAWFFRWRLRLGLVVLALIIGAAAYWAGGPARRRDKTLEIIDKADAAVRLTHHADAAFATMSDISDESLKDERVVQRLRAFAADHGRIVSAAMLRDQPFALGGSQDRSENEIRGERAERLLAVLKDDAELKFQSAFRRLIRNDFDGALRFAKTAVGDERCQTISAIAMAATAPANGDQSEAFGPLRRLFAAAPKAAATTIDALALRCFAHLFAVDNKLAVQDPNEVAAFAALRQKIDQQDPSGAGGGRMQNFAIALSARRYEIDGSFDLALKTAEPLLHGELPPGQRAAINAYCAVFQFRLAANAPDALRREASRKAAIQSLQCALSSEKDCRSGDRAATLHVVENAFQRLRDDAQPTATTPSALLAQSVVERAAELQGVRLGVHGLVGMSDAVRRAVEAEVGGLELAAGQSPNAIWSALFRLTSDDLDAQEALVFVDAASALVNGALAMYRSDRADSDAQAHGVRARDVAEAVVAVVKKQRTADPFNTLAAAALAEIAKAATGGNMPDAASSALDQILSAPEVDDEYRKAAVDNLRQLRNQFLAK